MNSAAISHRMRQNVRYALRMMRKAPAFTAIAVLTLALAIGANTAMFTVIRAVLLKPLPYPNANRLVRISQGATPTRFAEMRAAVLLFDGLAATTGGEDVTLIGGAEPEVVTGVRISANFLSVLGVRPLLGRTFRPGEDAPGGAPVAMISADLWQRRFGGDPGIIGRTALLSSVPYTIIGVLPHGFRFPFRDLDVWMTAPAEWPAIPVGSRRLSPYLTVFGRLKRGASLRQANAELKVIRQRYAAAHPAMLDAKPKTPEELTSMKDHLIADVRSMLWMLLGAVDVVLLIACANLAGMLLARANARSREFAVRAALGAPRGRLIGQLLTESVLLASFGGVLGLLLAVALVRAVPRLTALELPRTSEIHTDWLVFGFGSLLALLTGILFGLAPSLGASRPDLVEVLRTGCAAGNRTMAPAFSNGLSLRAVLSAGQVALSMVLLIGASLLMVSIAHLRGVDLGFNPAGLLTMRISLPVLRYDTEQKKAAFFHDLIRRTEALPGVQGAAAAMTLPMTGFAGIPVQDASQPPLRLNERLIAKYFPVTPGYFQMLGIALRRGRDFTDHDTKASERVAIIDETLARRFWPGYPGGINPVGQRLFIGGVSPKPALIVGVVANARQNIEGSVWPESVYVALAQNPVPFAMVAIRATNNPLSVVRGVREQVRAIDRDQPITDVRTMDDLVDEQVGQRHVLLAMLTSFAMLALLLAVIGIYGVTAYSVAQRTQEMGIRRALGAQQGDILRLVLRQGLLLAVAGIIAGTAAAIALTRVLKSLLFEVSVTDPAIFAAVGLLLLVAALAASWVPAWRATRIDPASALRT